MLTGDVIGTGAEPPGLNRIKYNYSQVKEIK